MSPLQIPLLSLSYMDRLSLDKCCTRAFWWFHFPWLVRANAAFYRQGHAEGIMAAVGRLLWPVLRGGIPTSKVTRYVCVSCKTSCEALYDTSLRRATLCVKLAINKWHLQSCTVPQASALLCVWKDITICNNIITPKTLLQGPSGFQRLFPDPHPCLVGFYFSDAHSACSYCSRHIIC